MEYSEEDFYIVKLKNAFARFDNPSAVNVAKEYVGRSAFTYPFLTKVIPGALSLIDEEWKGKVVSLTQIYRLGKVIESTGNYILQHVKESLYSHSEKKSRSTKILITNFNDWHEFGKVIIATFMKFEGYDVEDIGITMSLKTLVQKVIEKKPDILAISVLMVNSALRLKDLRKMLDENGCENVKIIAGGVPFSFDPGLAERLKFDGYADSPFAAMGLIEKVMRKP